MKRMLINATHTDEIRVAIADGQKLYDLDIDSAGHYRKKGNIYKAKITRVEPSLEACFVNYGSERHGFLPYKEISPAYCKQAPRGKARLPINEALKEGDEIIVQVNKEERGNKGAALSTFISLAGRYLVYMPGNHRAGGISRQIHGDKRAHLQDIMRRLEIPKNDGVIIRTAGLGRTFEELHWDFNYLQQVWEAIRTAAEQKKGPFFIYQESDLFIRALRDYLQPDIGEILIDDRASYEKAREFMQQVMPHNLKKLSYYNDTTPLFSRYQIERQIQSAFEREVKLPSGGSLVIDQTEALLSIDINSAKATKGIDVETTALNTNLEAADEIARQLKIRDLGGLVVIDFIDMRNNKNQREVENRMRNAAESDRARVQIGKISKFGLLEMSRQRLRSSIADSSQITCPTCGGHGFIRSMESLVISIIRLTEEEMIKPKTGRIVIQAPVEIVNKILNEKRTELSELESRHHVQVSVISNEFLSSPDFHVQRLNTNESHINIDSIKLVKPEDCHKAISLDPPPPTKEKPALSMVKPTTQAPKRSIILMISSWIKSLFAKPSKNNKKQHTRSYHNKNKNKPKNTNTQHKGQQNKKPQNKPQNKAQQRTDKQTVQKNNTRNQHIKKKGQQTNTNKGAQANNKANPNQAKQNQTAKQNIQPNKQQGQSNNPNSKSTNNKPNKGGKSIYGNKNKNKNNKNTTTAENKHTETDINTIKKMTRPLGSVAELAAKKDPVVPSGALKNRPIDNIQIDNNSNLNTNNDNKQKALQKDVKADNNNKNTQNHKTPTGNKKTQSGRHPSNKKATNKAVENKATENKATENKATENKAAENKATENKAAENKATENKATENKAAENKAAENKAAENKATENKATENKAAENKAAENKATENKATENKAAENKATENKATENKSGNSKSRSKKTTKKKTTKKTATKKTTAKKTTSDEKTPSQADGVKDSGSAVKSTTDKPKKTTKKKSTAKKSVSKTAENKSAAANNEKEATEKPATSTKTSQSSITAEMIKPGIYRAKKTD